MSSKDTQDNSAFQNTQVWKDATDLAVLVYGVTKTFPASEQFGLVSQLRRAVVSVSTNFAEGYGRTSKNDKKHFYVIAYGSLLEVKSLLYLSVKLGFCLGLEDIDQKIDNIRIQINAVRKSLSQ